jgi:ribosomal 50S subunit-associated protein YjgA (DUF615 family)
VVRKLEHYLADQAKADADNRNLVSRSEERREQQRIEARLFALATKLSGLKPQKLALLELTQAQLDVIDELRIIENPAARTRALKHLRAELRDFPVDELERRLAELFNPGPHGLRDAGTAWRDRLLNGKDADVFAFAEKFPSADPAQLRALVRNHQRAKEEERSRIAKRFLQAVRTAMQSPSTAPQPDDVLQELDAPDDG